MGLALAKDELPEIAVIGDEDAIVPPCDSKHLLIKKTWRIVTPNTLGVMTKLVQPGNKSPICTLVEQKFHKLEEGVARLARLRPTAVCA